MGPPPFHQLVAAALLLGTIGTDAAAQNATYRERYRPQVHFTPPVNWMNDPNGLVHYDGEYHLFYQYNPFGDRWGHMSWGHAVSRDLVHWEHLPVALTEEDGVMIFSGSAVVDWTNTSGFGDDEHPPLVAIYTGHRPADHNQSQHIAYSTDRGRTWTKYAGNPVIDIGARHFRDPKVFWHAPAQRWIMVLALAEDRKVRIYGSPDLKEWTHLSDFGPAGATSGQWECPDLFELPVGGEPGETRWVLQVDLNPGGRVGGSGGQYFIGRFDGTRFTPETTETRWLDWGADFYATMSWSDIPRQDGRRIWLAWMNNWQYAQEIPTSPWRSAQSLPRTVTLRRFDDGIRLVQRPVQELERLRGGRRTLGPRPIPDGTTPLDGEGIAGATLEILAELDTGSAAEVGLKVRTGDGEETTVGVDARAGRVFIDRTRSGVVEFHDAFAARHSGPLGVEGGRVRLHVFVDASSVEVFAGSGETVLTDRIFPSPESDGVALYAEGGTARLVSLEAWPLRSIWDRP